MFLFSFELEFRLSRNDVAIAFVNAILCPDGSDPVEISLSELQRRSKIRLICSSQNRMFLSKHAGLSIQNFTDRNKDWYEKLQNKHRITVRLLPKKIVEKKPLKVQGKGSESDQYSFSANEASDLDKVVTDYETASSHIERDQPASGCGDAVKEKNSPYDVFVEKKSSELWRQKSKKRVRKTIFI